MERSRSQAVPSQSNLPQSDFVNAGEVLDDTEIEPASTVEDDGEASVADNGHSTNTHASTTEATAEAASGHEAAAEVPALTAETQPDAALPSLEAMAVSEPASEPESDTAPAQPTGSEQEPAPAHQSADTSNGDEGRNGASGQQPSVTRADFAEIQKVLGQAALQDSVSESNSGEVEAASYFSATAEATPEDANTADVTSHEAASDQADEQQAADEDTDQAAAEAEAASEQTGPVAEPELPAVKSAAALPDLPPAVHQSAPTIAPAATEAIEGGGTEKQPAIGIKRLPSLPARRGAPSLPSRSPAASTSASAGQSAPLDCASLLHSAKVLAHT